MKVIDKHSQSLHPWQAQLRQGIIMDVMRKEEIIAALNEAWQAELKAVKMYDSHARAIADAEIRQGLRTIQEVEEGHAHALATRIRDLDGKPAAAEFTEAPSYPSPTSDPAVVADMLRLDLADEGWAIKHYAGTIADFFLDADDETLTVLEENLVDELRHARWLRDRLRLLIRSK
jgi:bacterioferritin (cytochrome b1)